MTTTSEQTALTPVALEEKKSWFSENYDKIKEYGKVGIITHLALSWSTLLALFLIVKRTPYGGKIVDFLKLSNRIPKSAGSFAIAGIIYKFIMPARIAVSVMAIPLVIKTFDIQVEPSKTEIKNQTGEILADAGISKSSPQWMNFDRLILIFISLFRCIFQI